MGIYMDGKALFCLSEETPGSSKNFDSLVSCCCDVLFSLGPGLDSMDHWMLAKLSKLRSDLKTSHDGVVLKEVYVWQRWHCT